VKNYPPADAATALAAVCTLIAFYHRRRRGFEDGRHKVRYNASPKKC